MVFLDKNAQNILLNRHFEQDCVKIELLNNFTRDTLTLEDLVDTSDSDYYYVFEGLDLSQLIDGEYVVSLYNPDGKLIEQMLGVCGDYKKQRTSYKKENNSRIVYER